MLALKPALPKTSMPRRAVLLGHRRTIKGPAVPFVLGSDGM
jgi:hypothetical protein